MIFDIFGVFFGLQFEPKKLKKWAREKIEKKQFFEIGGNSAPACGASFPITLLASIFKSCLARPTSKEGGGL